MDDVCRLDPKSNTLFPVTAKSLVLLSFGLGSLSLTQNLADVGIVHVGEGLEDLAPLVLGPHHECIHWPFNVWLVAVPSPGFSEDPCLCRCSASCWPTIIG